MKTILLAAVLASVIIPIKGHATELMEVARFTVGGAKVVDLPVTRDADGSMCRTFVAAADRRGDMISASTRVLCGPVASLPGGPFGGEQIYVGTLVAMQMVVVGDLAVQLPITHDRDAKAGTDRICRSFVSRVVNDGNHQAVETDQVCVTMINPDGIKAPLPLLNERADLWGAL